MELNIRNIIISSALTISTLACNSDLETHSNSIQFNSIQGKWTFLEHQCGDVSLPMDGLEEQVEIVITHDRFELRLLNDKGVVYFSRITDLDSEKITMAPPEMDQIYRVDMRKTDEFNSKKYKDTPDSYHYQLIQNTVTFTSEEDAFCKKKGLQGPYKWTLVRA